MTVSLEMVIPGCMGIWIDVKLGTKFLFALIGFGLGMTFGIWHLIRMTGVVDQNANQNNPQPPQKGTPDH